MALERNKIGISMKFVLKIYIALSLLMLNVSYSLLAEDLNKGGLNDETHFLQFVIEYDKNGEMCVNKVTLDNKEIKYDGSFVARLNDAVIKFGDSTSLTISGVVSVTGYYPTGEIERKGFTDEYFPFSCFSPKERQGLRETIRKKCPQLIIFPNQTIAKSRKKSL
jgi:hypothetical protein